MQGYAGSGCDANTRPFLNIPNQLAPKARELERIFESASKAVGTAEDLRQRLASIVGRTVGHAPTPSAGVGRGEGPPTDNDVGRIGVTLSALHDRLNEIAIHVARLEEL